MTSRRAGREGEDTGINMTRLHEKSFAVSLLQLLT